MDTDSRQELQDGDSQLMSKTKFDKKLNAEELIEQQNHEISTLKNLLKQKNFDAEKLEQECEHLKNIISLMPGHVYWQNTEGVFLGCNYLQAKDAGLESIHDYLGKTDYDMPWKAQADILCQINKKVLQTGEPHIAEEPSHLADGTYAIFLSQKVPLKDKNGEIAGIVGISFDITERKKMEQQLAEQVVKTQKANRSKTIFLETASHEVRGPVGNIIALTNDAQSYIEKLRNIIFGKVVELVNNREEKKSLLIY